MAAGPPSPRRPQKSDYGGSVNGDGGGRHNRLSATTTKTGGRRRRVADEAAAAATAPDGGFGWVICGATFLCHFVVGGTYYSFGIMLPDLIKYFDSDHVTISMIGSGNLQS